MRATDKRVAFNRAALRLRPRYGLYHRLLVYPHVVRLSRVDGQVDGLRVLGPVDLHDHPRRPISPAAHIGHREVNLEGEHDLRLEVLDQRREALVVVLEGEALTRTI